MIQDSDSLLVKVAGMVSTALTTFQDLRNTHICNREEGFGILNTQTIDRADMQASTCRIT